MTAEFAVR